MASEISQARRPYTCPAFFFSRANADGLGRSASAQETHLFFSKKTRRVSPRPFRRYPLIRSSPSALAVGMPRKVAQNPCSSAHMLSSYVGTRATCQHTCRHTSQPPCPRTLHHARPVRMPSSLSELCTIGSHYYTGHNYIGHNYTGHDYIGTTG